ncbi:CoA-transferase subunit beta [Paeniglutamicibacter gangotriensis]|uniref:Coenzyme A transferase n=1 Tax=Paeniglutamicibacter gangotriensis Lz1y TaxID=1276920 RepID=M7NEL8_9MICC|nr:CoA-transferase [Paeniglutamicibacter gangotriensis]EMR00240.1 coenzyme A transferase [Paeniglutamicibacter gangotriensis Lz1y]
MSEVTIPQSTRAEIAVTACSDLFHGQGDILASPAGIIPTIGARLAALTHAPDLMLSDGESTIYAGVPALEHQGVPGGYLPYRELFELIAAGKRHVVMGGAQIDREGNHNFSAIGQHSKPHRQLLGARAAAANTINHRTSYWIPKHSRRSMVERVDFVTGVGRTRAENAGKRAARFHQVHQVVSNLGVFDFSGPGHTMSLVSIHPGVIVEEVIESTGFALNIPDAVQSTRLPNRQELHLIREVLDPLQRREQEVRS